MTDREFVAVGPRTRFAVPEEATVIDAHDHHPLHGLSDTSVHASRGGGGEILSRSCDRGSDLVKESTQVHRSHGDTTTRGSYGALHPSTRISGINEPGEIAGPQMQATDDIVGCGGPCPVSYAMVYPLKFDELALKCNNEFTQGGSREATFHLPPAEVREAINRYLDLGPDHIRYGATTQNPASFIFISSNAQLALVEGMHRRGLSVHPFHRARGYAPGRSGWDRHPRAPEDLVAGGPRQASGPEPGARDHLPHPSQRDHSQSVAALPGEQRGAPRPGTQSHAAQCAQPHRGCQPPDRGDRQIFRRGVRALTEPNAYNARTGDRHVNRPVNASMSLGLRRVNPSRMRIATDCWR